MVDTHSDTTSRRVLIFSCSGASNTGEAADRAARELMAAGLSGACCLAGIGAGVEGMVQAARDADVNLVIDGCETDCGRKVLEKAGIRYIPIRVTDLGIQKIKGIRATGEQVAKVVKKAQDVLGGGK